jgi:hypothetical protein
MIFWKWWTINVLFTVGFVFSEYKFNSISYLIENDISYLSLVIITIFVITNIQIGIKCYNLQFNNQYLYEEDLNPNWFNSDLVMSIGMVGTLLGFILVLNSAFTDMNPENTDKMKEIIAQVAQGMGVAILTTLTGLISSIILKFNLVMLEKENAKKI